MLYSSTQAMKQELVDYKDEVSSVQLKGKQAVPIKERKSELKESKAVQAVCDYLQSHVSQLHFSIIIPLICTPF